MKFKEYMNEMIEDVNDIQGLLMMELRKQFNSKKYMGKYSMDIDSFGLYISWFMEDNPITVNATPYYDGSTGLEVEVMSDGDEIYSGKISGFELNKTSDLSREALVKLYLKLITPVLKKYLK